MNIRSLGQMAVSGIKSGVSLAKRGFEAARDVVVEHGKKALAFGAAALGLKAATQPAAAALVSYDGTNVSWSVSDLLTPLTTALVAAIGAAVVIFTIVVGVRWIFRMVKSK